MECSAYDLAERFVGLKEAKGPTSNAQVLAMLQLDAGWVADDSVAWCSAAVNYIAWLLRLPRSKNLAARSWLAVGTVVPRIEDARRGYDVVILKRGGGDQPGPEVLEGAPGHVGFFSGYEPSRKLVWVLGGNQSDQMSVAPFHVESVLGIRRLSG